MKQTILSYIHAECPWRDTLHWHPSLDSTNTQAKRLAQQGAPQGTVVIARQQTAGRGRLGRSFCSDQGMGVYLSAILRPNCKPEQLMHLTCAAAVAACQAVQAAAGVWPDIKWVNDLILQGKKLGGILTELQVGSHGLVDYAVVGIGINCLEEADQFPAPLGDIATSLHARGYPVSIPALAAALVEALARMADRLFTEKSALMATYRDRCITLGRDVVLLQPEHTQEGKAVDLDENGSLLVTFSDGSSQWVQSGEASIRGIAGYV